jgi:hypothetical protein
MQTCQSGDFGIKRRDEGGQNTGVEFPTAAPNILRLGHEPLKFLMVAASALRNFSLGARVADCLSLLWAGLWAFRFAEGMQRIETAGDLNQFELSYPRVSACG